jgi:hypothetical protein
MWNLADPAHPALIAVTTEPVKCVAVTTTA